jgi:iron complex outermembrane receptor protein
MATSRRTRLALGCGVALGAALAAAGVEAQTAAPSTDTATQISEIIVTATKRQESLQDVPVSMSVLTSEQLRKTDALSLKDLQYVVPDFDFGGESTVRRPDIALRGIQSATRVPGYEGSIGFFVDGVYEPFPDQWDNPVLDLDRIEVLYGPQDTLFGKNTIAGAISIVTKKPGDTFGGDASAEYGNYNYYSFRADVDVPLIKDVLAARLSGIVGERDGYITNIYNGDKLDNMNEQGVRLQLRYTPTPHFEAIFEAGMFQEVVAELQADVLGEADSTSSPWQVDINTPPKTARYLYDSHLTLNYTLDDGATLTSITAWAQTRALYRTDEDGDPIDAWETNIYDRNHDFQQELRYTSAPGKRFDYVTGVYYLQTYWEAPGSIQTLPSDPLNQPGGTGLLDANGDLTYAKGSYVTSESYAVYYNGNYHFGHGLTLTAGGRFSHDDKYLDYLGQQNYAAGFLNFFEPGGVEAVKPSYSASLSKSEATGSIALDYKVVPGVLLYASVANGYKAGGWATDFGQPYPPQQFKPDLFDKRLRLDVDLFYMDYTNKQEEIYLGPINGFVISNAAAAHVKGFEASTTFVITKGLTFNSGLSYTDPIYSSFPNCQSPSGAPADCTGKQLVFSTRWNANASLEYTQPIPDLGKIDLLAGVTYRDKMYFDTLNQPSEEIPPYTLINARAALDLRDGRTEIFLFAKNLADKTYLVSKFAGSEGIALSGTSSVLYAEPRMFGGGVRFRF